MNPEMLSDFLLNIVRQVAIIPTEELEAHLKRSQDALNYQHNIGWAIDPTTYSKLLYGKGFDNAEIQIKMVKHLLGLRKLVDEYEALRISINPPYPNE